MKDTKSPKPNLTLKQAIKKNLLYLLLGIVVMAFALVNVGISIASQANSNFILNHGVKAEATITSVDQIFKKNRTDFIPHTLYVVEAKVYRNTWTQLASGTTDSIAVGSKLSISYLESDPSQVVLTGKNLNRESFQPSAVAIAYGLLGLVGFSFGLRNVIRTRTRKEKVAPDQGKRNL